MGSGHLNLKDALDRSIDVTSADGKDYRLAPDEALATIVVRPRGWHLEETHVLVDGQRISGSLFDFAMYFFHCARRQLAKGKGPYFFFSSRRRHTRYWRDWSSDVCSSDLGRKRLLEDWQWRETGCGS